MTLSSGTSSGSSQETRSSGSDGDLNLQAQMEQKRKRRMESNRESARRSRMRKQQHLDDLTSQVNHLRKEKHQVLTALNMTTQNYAAVEAQNSVLRTQKMELESRLYALNEILCSLNANACTAATATATTTTTTTSDVFSTTTAQMMSPWSSLMHMNQPIDLYQCF